MDITLRYFDGIKIHLHSVEEVKELPAAQVSIKTYGNIAVIHKNVEIISVTGFYRKDNS